MLGADFPTLVAEWAAALYVDGRVAVQDAGDLQLTSWNLEDVFSARPIEQRLQPVDVAFSPFEMDRTVIGGGTAYMRLTSVGAHDALAVRLDDGFGSPPSDLLRPRVWVVRIQ